MKQITIEQLHQETERWVKAAAADGVVVTDHGQPVATLSQPAPVKRAQWLQERLGALKMQPLVAVDSAELISDDRNRA